MVVNSFILFVHRRMATLAVAGLRPHMSKTEGS